MAKGDRRVITATVGGDPVIIVHEGESVSLVEFTCTGRQQLYSNNRIKKDTK